jgi:tRNA(Ile)-lysidine synthase
MDVTRLAALPPALQRRLLRFAAKQLGAAIDFPSTEALCNLALTGRAGQKLQLAQGILAERTARELRLAFVPVAPADMRTAVPSPTYKVAIPGEVTAPAFGLRLRIEVAESDTPSEVHFATLRNWKPGDRVRLRYSSAPHRVKEVLERLKVTGSSRSCWPVLELDGQIVWMQGVELEPKPGIRIASACLETAADSAP